MTDGGSTRGTNVHQVYSGNQLLGSAKTTRALFPGQGEALTVTAMPGAATVNDTFIARIFVDPQNPTFRECRTDNNESPPAHPLCVQ